MPPSRRDDPAGWARWYLAENAHVYAAFARLVDDRRAARPGLRLSADMVLHVVRWNTAVREDGGFKVNNDASALLARVYEAQRLARGTFELRSSWCDDLTVDVWRDLMLLADDAAPYPHDPGSV